MLMDKQQILADAQTLIHAAGSWNSDNIIDLWGGVSLPSGPLGTPPYDFGKGGSMRILAQIVETFLAAAGAATLQIALVNADDAPLTVNPITLAKTEAITKVDLVAGYQFTELGFVPAKCVRRYLGAILTIATNPGTAGKLTLALLFDRQEVGLV